MKHKKPTYETTSGWQCPNCGEEARIVPDMSEFDHEFGTEYPSGWGQPICDSCEHPIDDAEPEEYPNYLSDY